jgi:hypothetical protein
VSTQQNEAGAYVPRLGDRVTVRRYIAPTTGKRELSSVRTGEITNLHPEHGEYRIWLDGSPEWIFTGDQFLGAGTDGSGPASLVIEVTPDTGEREPDAGLARLRLRQAQERIATRFPRVARDSQLASALESLGDALGAGPEASDPEHASAREGDVSRQRLSPDLWVVVDASLNTVLEVTTPFDRIVRRVLVSRSAVREALETAYALTVKAEGEIEESRRRGRDERRRAQGRLTQPEAVEWLTGKGRSRRMAVWIAGQLRDGYYVLDAFGMTYDGTCWVVPVITEQPAR